MKKTRFTLVELLVVIGIIGILAALVIPAAGMARAAGKKTECINNKGELIKAMQLYANENKSAMIYRGHKGSDNVTYAAVLAGWDVESPKHYAKRYVADEVLMCSLTKDKHNDDYTNVAGMLKAITADALTGAADVTASTGWLKQTAKGGSNNTFAKVFGSFASSKDNHTVIYDADKIKNPGGLLIFADAFQRNSNGSTDPYWNFVPHTPSDGNSVNSCVTLIHSNQTAGAFADGHAEGMDPGRLKDCATEVKAFNSDSCDKDKNSDN